MAVDAGGQVYTWGQGKWGATGLSHVDNVCTPQQVERLAGERVISAAAGGRHTLFLTAGNEVWASGCNENGQAGGEMGGTVMAPRKVTGFPPEHCEVCFLDAGGDHSIAVVQQRVGGLGDGSEDTNTSSEAAAKEAAAQSAEIGAVGAGATGAPTGGACPIAMLQRQQWDAPLRPASLHSLVLVAA